ncbi:hypothetical protein [Belliella aquatica]|uniref:Uncharacterized protein n=1 Tax=Belliella aquatica TaxID=1323734 RepID=A0ABQ1M0B4_9BACT|nr:hypothetical protein [Belliella aquatica]MCH7406850.1 hypothetical protein [Belliella aquatica]GGC32221.1 hypothetical protein GCM10010993_09020 [Belliella aquatica]
MENIIHKGITPEKVSLAELLFYKEKQIKMAVAHYLHQLEVRLSIQQRICTYLLLAFVSSGLLVQGLFKSTISSNPKSPKSISISAGDMKPVGLFPVWQDSLENKFQPKTNTSWKIND